MMLDLSYDIVAEWFDSSHRSPNSLADAVLTLIKHGYTIEFMDSRGFGLNGGTRRLIASVGDIKPLANGESFQIAHVFVADEDESIIDPNPRTKERFNANALLSRMPAGMRIEWVALIKSLV